MFGREPVAIAGTVRAIILCAVAFGLKWTPEQIGATMLAVEAVLTLITRQSVTPNQTVQQNFVKVPKTLVVLLLACALGSGCMGTARHRATVTVVSAHAVLSAVQDGEALLVCGRPTAPPPPQCVSAATHREVSAKLALAFDYDGKIAKLVRAMPANASSPDVAAMLGQIGALIDAVFHLIPDSPKRQALAAQVGAR